MEGYPDSDYPHAEPWRADPSLEAFYYDDLITDVLRPIKPGKEATVYCCRAHPSTGANLLAAKVFRVWLEPGLKREHRTGGDLLADDRRSPQTRSSFRRRAIYEEGREIADARLRRAFQNRSAMGRRLRFGGWVDREFTVLCRLFDAGADVPAPVARSGPAILMEYLGDEINPAPMLKHVSLEREQARTLFDVVLRNVELFLARDLVHADLSAFNVLYWDGKVKIIDFPQAVDAFDNPNAQSLLSRDIYNVCRYFARYGISADPSRLAEDLWQRFLRRELR